MRRIACACLLVLAAPVAAHGQDSPPTLSRVTNLTTTGPGYVRVTVPQLVKAAEGSGTEGNWRVRFSDPDFAEEVVISSEFKSSDCPGCPATPHSASRGVTGGSVNAHLPPGTYRLYLITTPHKTVSATIELDGLPAGEQAVATTTAIPSSHAPLARRAVPSGREVYTATVQVPPHATIVYHHRWTNERTDIAVFETCKYKPAESDPNRADAFDRGCPGATNRNTSSSTSDYNGRGLGGFGPGPAGPFTYAMGVDRVSGGGTLTGAAFAYSLDLPDDLRPKPIEETFAESKRQPPAPTTAPGQDAPPGQPATVSLPQAAVTASPSIAAVPLTCRATTTCRGTVRFGGGTARDFAVAAGATKSIRVKLSARQRRTLARDGRVRATLQIYGKGVKDAKRTLTIRRRS